MKSIERELRPRPGRRRGGVAPWIGALALAFAPPVEAAAQEAEATEAEAPEAEARDEARDERARILFEAARVHFDAGEYERALPEFEEAYELSGRRALLYNIGVTRERIGDFAGALEAFEAFLEADIEVPGMDRAQLERRVEALRERVARAARGEPEPAPEPAPSPAAEDAPVGPIVLFSVAGAALLSGAIFGGLTVAEDGSLASGCASTAAGCSDAELGDIRAFRVVADVSFALSLAAAGAALVWWLLGRGDGAPAGDDVALSPWLDPTGASAGLVGHGRFRGL